MRTRACMPAGVPPASLQTGTLCALRRACPVPLQACALTHRHIECSHTPACLALDASAKSCLASSDSGSLGGIPAWRLPEAGCRHPADRQPLPPTRGPRTATGKGSYLLEFAQPWRRPERTGSRGERTRTRRQWCRQPCDEGSPQDAACSMPTPAVRETRFRGRGCPAHPRLAHALPRPAWPSVHALGR